jgi:hypothetical protein
MNTPSRRAIDGALVAGLPLPSLNGWDLAGEDLAGLDLSGADLSYARLDGTVLDGCHLGRAILFGATAVGASVRGTDLRGASLMAADLSYTDLRGALLGGADVTGTNLTGAWLDNSAELVTRGAIVHPEGADTTVLRVGTGHRGTASVRLRVGGVLLIEGDDLPAARDWIRTPPTLLSAGDGRSARFRAAKTGEGRIEARGPDGGVSVSVAVLISAR